MPIFKLIFIVLSRRDFLLIFDRLSHRINNHKTKFLNLSSNKKHIPSRNKLWSFEQSLKERRWQKNKLLRWFNLLYFKYLPAWHWEPLICFIFTACYILCLFCRLYNNFASVSSLKNLVSFFELWIPTNLLVIETDKQCIDCSIFEHHFLRHISTYTHFWALKSQRLHLIFLRWTLNIEMVSFSFCKISNFISATIKWHTNSSLVSRTVAKNIFPMHFLHVFSFYEKTANGFVLSFVFFSSREILSSLLIFTFAVVKMHPRKKSL